MNQLLIADGAYALMQIVSICALTRGRRGWGWTLLGGLVLLAAHAACFGFGAVAGLSPCALFQIGFPVLWIPLAILLVLLSRDELGRRVFLAADYAAYFAAFVPLCQTLIRHLPPPWGAACACALIVFAHLVFLFALVPLVPSSTRTSIWNVGTLVAVLFAVLLYACGVWPHSLAACGWEGWVAFLLATAVAWVVFPIIYAGMRAHLKSIGVERSLALMSGEVAVRRAAIDAARRQRHDQRHHRIVLSELLLRGQSEKALSYLEQLDAEAEETPTGKLVWCENETLNAILSGCAHRAEARGVEFSVEAHVEKAIGIRDIDLVALVANLVENAINAAQWRSDIPVASEKERIRPCSEATGKSLLHLESLLHSEKSLLHSEKSLLHSEKSLLHSQPHSRVCVLLRQRERTFGMTVTNSVPPGFALSEKGIPCEEPGIGLESVRRVLDRYAGELTYVLSDGILACRALVKLGKA